MFNIQNAVCCILDELYAVLRIQNNIKGVVDYHFTFFKL